MSQNSAAWNLAAQLIPAVGLVFVFLGPMARFAPVRFLPSAQLYTRLACLFVAAKASLFRQGRYLSLGSKYMSAWNRRAYRTGYVLMMVGIVATVFFTVMWHAQ